MEDNSRDELDRLIDGALSAYSGAEPLAGLEERVLQRIVVAEGARRRAVWWRWALALPVLASLAWVTILLRVEPLPAPKVTVIGNVDWTEPALPKVTPKLPERKTARLPKPLPKLEQFPAPSPITAEERAWLAFVDRAPALAQETFRELEKRNSEKIEIREIQIPPLVTDAGQ